MPFVSFVESFTEKSFDRKFPVVITDNLRLNKERTKIAIISDCPEEDPLFPLSDPKMEYELNDYVFFQPFLNTEASLVKEEIYKLVSDGIFDDEHSILLIRKEDDSIFCYSYGEIAKDWLPLQNDICALLPDSFQYSDIFFLPLKRHFFMCPACRQRTMTVDGMCFICSECGWEYDCNKENVYSGCNDCTVNEYRREYLKEKLKNPNYAWYRRHEDN